MYFLPRPTKKFSLQNGEKTKGRNWASFLDKNARVQLHMGFIHVAFLHIFFFFSLMLLAFFPPPRQCLLLLLFFFFSLIYWAGVACLFCFFLFIYLLIYFLIYWAGLSSIFFFLLSFVCFFLDVIFFYGHDFYFLINSGD